MLIIFITINYYYYTTGSAAVAEIDDRTVLEILAAKNSNSINNIT